MAGIILKQNNLYRNGTIVVGTTGEKILIREQLEFENHATNKYHTITQFDRLDLLAFDYYKNFVEDPAKYWWIIADTNNIENPLDLTDLIGKRIVIPEILRVLLTI